MWIDLLVVIKIVGEEKFLSIYFWIERESKYSLSTMGATEVTAWR